MWQLTLSLVTQITYINITKVLEIRHTKNYVVGVHVQLVLCFLPNQSLCICESYTTGRCPVSLLIGNNFHLSMLEHTHTTVGCAQFLLPVLSPFSELLNVKLYVTGLTKCKNKPNFQRPRSMTTV
jgi:hypothetical protein